jgi:hypothetical protein
MGVLFYKYLRPFLEIVVAGPPPVGLVYWKDENDDYWQDTNGDYFGALG